MNAPKTVLKTVQLVHLAMVLGLVVFGLFGYFQSEGFVYSTDGDIDVFLYLVPIVVLVGYFGSQIVFNKMLSKIRSNDPMATKLAKYQMATLMKFVCIEVPTLLALLAFYLTSNALYLVIAICMTAYLFVQRPNLSRLLVDVQLNAEEKKIIDTIIK